MTAATQKIVQYLEEAHATEHALVRVLQSQIAMTPRGSYRTGLDTHLKETRRHAEDVGRRLEELGHGGNPLAAVVGLFETLMGQMLALSKTPLDIVRGSGGAEKILKNAKDTCATEALEIATYTVLEQLARAVGDDKTARLAAGILAEEQNMLRRVTEELPKLTDAMVRAEIEGLDTYDITTTGAAEAAQEAVAATRSTARKAKGKAKASAAKTTTRAKKTARQARKVPGVAQAEGEVKGALADASDLPIARYDKLTAEEISGRLPGLSQIDLAKVDAYERKSEDRSTILDRVATLRGDEPWPGYDELNAADVRARLADGDDELAARVRAYERAHKGRAGVQEAAERTSTTA